MRSLSEKVKKFTVGPEHVEGRGDHAEGFERDFDPPAADEVEQLNEPAIEQTLQMVTEAISNISASLETLESNMAASNSGNGRGDDRQAGPEGEGEKIVPRGERWELKFTARDKRNYLLQLDSLKIDVGAIGGGVATVDYVTSVGTNPTKRSGTSKEFKGKLYFTSTALNVLEQYEKQVLQSAGFPIAGRQILKFVPAETEKLLQQAEYDYFGEKRSKDVRIAEIAKTVFECRQRKKGGGYEFVVIDQRYRTAPGGKK
jgi:hypothetical protein